MSLMLHRGAVDIDYDGLRSLVTPPATPTHVPLPHHQLVEMMKYALPFYGHEIVEEHHGITEDGARYFGLLTLKSTYGSYTDTVGLRNSHDKSFPIGVAFGSRVFVCDNLSFIAEHVVRRKHTANAKRELPALVAELVEPLAHQRQRQHEAFERYSQTGLNDERADHAIMTMFRKGILNIQRVPDVLEQWETPKFDWGDKTAWRLFNAATFSLTGRVSEDPGTTKRLHEVIDGVCEVVS
jgi:hypothetical protein